MKYFYFAIILFLSIPFLNAQNDTFRVVGYFPNWYDVPSVARQLDYSHLTHIDYAFTNPDATGTLADMGSDLDTVVKRAHAKNVKVMISLGGGDLDATIIGYYTDLFSTTAKCAAFVHNIINFVNQYKLDGVDVDLEGDAITANYGIFIQQLADSLHPKGKLVTAAVSGWGDDNIGDAALQLFDWINIMSYDATGPWAPDNPGQHSSFEFAQYGINVWSARGLNKNKLVVGVPFYGHGFGKELDTDGIDYSVIIGRFPYAYDQDTVGNIIYYNGVITIQQKTCLAMDQASGVMIWALTSDTEDTTTSLLYAIGRAIKTYNKNDIPPIVKILSPGNNDTINNSNLSVITIIKDSIGIFQQAVLSINGIETEETKLSLDTFHLNNLSAGTYSIAIKGIDFQGKAGYDSIHVLVSDKIARTPFNGIAAVVPGKVEAENYDVGGNNITYYVTTTTNEGGQYRYDAVGIEDCSDAGGGYDVGWISPGEWLEYTIDVKDSGKYDIDFRVAAISSGLRFSMSIDSNDVTGILIVPNTGDWQSWASVNASEIQLNKGLHIMRLNCIDGDMNFNYINFTLSLQNGISELIDKSGIVESPNPVTNYFLLNIQNSKDSNARIDIMDQTGKVVMSKEIKLISNAPARVDIPDLAQGIYILKVTTSSNCLTKQIIVSHN